MRNHIYGFLFTALCFKFHVIFGQQPEHNRILTVAFQTWRECHADEGFTGIISPSIQIAIDHCDSVNITNRECWVACLATESGLVKHRHYDPEGTRLIFATLFELPRGLPRLQKWVEDTDKCMMKWHGLGGRWPLIYDDCQEEIGPLIRCIAESMNCPGDSTSDPFFDVTIKHVVQTQPPTEIPTTTTTTTTSAPPPPPPETAVPEPPPIEGLGEHDTLLEEEPFPSQEVVTVAKPTEAPVRRRPHHRRGPASYPTIVQGRHDRINPGMTESHSDRVHRIFQTWECHPGFNGIIPPAVENAMKACDKFNITKQTCYKACLASELGIIQHEQYNAENDRNALLPMFHLPEGNPTLEYWLAENKNCFQEWSVSENLWPKHYKGTCWMIRSLARCVMSARQCTKKR